MTGLFSLEGKVAVVTGGGRGLGRAMAHALAAHGARVVIAGRNAETLEQAAAAMSAEGLRVEGEVCDVSDEAAVERLASRVGRPDILINNAGVNPFYRSAEKVTTDEWRQVLDVNLTGVFLACRAFGRLMLEQGGGAIVNVTSIAGHVGLERSAAYCAAKGGVELLSKSLALDWAKRGVRVNCLAPGYIETDLTAGLRDNPTLAERITSKTPMGRFGAPDDLAGAVVFLASDASRYVTGQTLLVDGGWTAQ
jgi:NAD(P)-dependent dehydrogenase (short-subunit alcohol dehydrogenase family)